ncbi:MAG: transglycosylase domain-containing protein [Lachnospiraceae bacterium]|jgi:monofunctional glycosyltransferase|nr:transglycosylase domain-containing protein [Lachnospiraceae bacterium]
MRFCDIFRSIVLLVMSVMLLAGFTVSSQGYNRYKEALEDMSLEEKVASIQAKEGYTRLEELPQIYVNGVVSVEDHRFYRHFGIDPIAIGRALLHDIQARRYVEGGSTITQQLAKNLYFTQEKELSRKVAEVFMAFQLEQKYSKDEILELYVNSIYFGDGYYTAGDASRGYFGKEPSEMNQYECTLLAGIPNAPGRYAPTKSQELAEKRQRQVLRRMEDCGYLSQEEVETVAAQMVALQ